MTPQYSFREEDFLLSLPMRGGKRVDVRLPNIGMLDNLARFLRYPFFQPTDQPMSVVDAGACVGAFCLAVKEQVPNATLHAFEPYPPCWPYLAENTAGLSGVTLYRHALGAVGGWAGLGRPNTAVITIGQTSLHGQLAEAVEVEVKTLDSVLGGQEIHVLKADVEGAELDVLKGARNILKEQRPLLILELKEGNQGRAGHSVKDVTDWLAAHGYGKPQGLAYGDFLFAPVKDHPLKLQPVDRMAA